MDDYEYYGLFLTQESKDKLAKWLFFNGYLPESELMKKRTGWYLDHCTLLHKSQRTSHFLLEDTLSTALIMYGSIIESIKIDGIGISDKAMAFRVVYPSNLCANKIPHITICTSNGGKPVDSNYITEWKDIEPITVEVKLEKR